MDGQQFSTEAEVLQSRAWPRGNKSSNSSSSGKGGNVWWSKIKKSLVSSPVCDQLPFQNQAPKLTVAQPESEGPGASSLNEDECE